MSFDDIKPKTSRARSSKIAQGLFLVAFEHHVASSESCVEKTRCYATFLGQLHIHCTVELLQIVTVTAKCTLYTSVLMGRLYGNVILGRTFVPWKAAGITFFEDTVSSHSVNSFCPSSHLLLECRVGRGKVRRLSIIRFCGAGTTSEHFKGSPVFGQF